MYVIVQHILNSWKIYFSNVSWNTHSDTSFSWWDTPGNTWKYTGKNFFFTPGKILFRRVSELNNKVSLPIYMLILLLLITVKYIIKFCFQVRDIYWHNSHKFWYFAMPFNGILKWCLFPRHFLVEGHNRGNSEYLPPEYLPPDLMSRK